MEPHSEGSDLDRGYKAWRLNFIIYCATVVGIFLIDQLVKVWARSEGEVEGRVFGVLWPGVFELKLVYNSGIAFGMLEGAGLYIAPIALVILGLVTYFAWNKRDEPRIYFVTYGLLVAGALGNMFDRLVYGKVTDMFWIRAIDFPVFNVADVAITVFVVLVIIALIADFRRGHPNGEQDLSSVDPVPNDFEPERAEVERDRETE